MANDSGSKILKNTHVLPLPPPPPPPKEKSVFLRCYNDDVPWISEISSSDKPMKSQRYRNLYSRLMESFSSSKFLTGVLVIVNLRHTRLHD